MSCTKEVVFEYETKVINTIDFDECLHEQCPELHLEFVHMIAPPSLAKVVNESIHKKLKSELTIVGQEVETIEQAAQAYLNNSQTAYPEDSVMSETHELQVVVRPSFQSNELLSLRMEMYEFAGGAHGFEGLLYKNFDVNTRKELTHATFFTDVEAFTAFAKAAFDEQQVKISETAPNGDSFLFENDLFRLPENLGLIEEGLHLYYHMYEIAPYQSEAFEMYIPWDEVKEYINL